MRDSSEMKAPQPGQCNQLVHDSIAQESFDGYFNKPLFEKADYVSRATLCFFSLQFTAMGP